MTQMAADQRDPQTYAVIGAAMAVHQEPGPGFLEAAYQEALAVELSERGIPGSERSPWRRSTVDKSSHVRNRADFVRDGEVIVELKALAALTTIEHAQVINYLRASKLIRGLLLNSDAPRREYKRFVRTASQVTRQQTQ